ncbi:MAG: tetratricopeptide repeat protein [Nitrosopumilaceae archaeon]
MVEILELVSKGKAFLENGQYSEALGCFEQAIFLNQNDAELWNFKAVSLRSLGRYEEAIECFNKSLEIDPRDRNAS